MSGWLARPVCRLAGRMFAAGLVACIARPARSQSLTVSGSPAAMKITAATAGAAPTAVSNALTTYSTRTTNGAGPKKITAQLNSNMPAGVTLTINLAAVTGSVAVGAVSLDNTARTVLNNITTTTVRTGAITYTLSATP